ncbi:MAG: hypothetical protein J5I50_00210 [Chitinophagaceae bacterium]|nr:hypothetical protein [Chitinophagaceae bacterium]
MKTIKIFLVFLAVVVFTAGCDKDLLDVPNYNDPTFEQVFSSGEDLENSASGLVNIIFWGQHAYGSVQMMLAVAADNVSCSWGNAAMRDMSWEPRKEWDNAPSYSNKGFLAATWNRMYAAIGQATNIIKAIDNGVEIGEGGSGTNRTKAMARYAMGVAYGTLALVFDQAFIVDESKTIEDASLEKASPYNEVAEAALGYLDEAISLSSGFTVPANWLGTPSDYSADDFKKLCNTMAARILSYTPRNKTDNNAVNWTRVKSYADNGITSNYEILQDEYVDWYFEAADYLTFNGWGITDMYTVHMMDPTVQPQHWDDSPSFPYPPQSTNPLDKRLDSDFEYVPSNWFDPARGYYHFSSYRFSKYDAVMVNADGPLNEVSKAENDMLRAEAMAHIGSDLAGAAAIINAGTRVTRGQMPPVAANADEIFDAIHHERFVEMYVTGMGLQFFEMRKNDLLQKGTPLHMPVPSSVLENLGMAPPFYTFGGVANADGKNTSNGGWR